MHKLLAISFICSWYLVSLIAEPRPYIIDDFAMYS